MKSMTDEQLAKMWLISDRIHWATNELRKLHTLLAEKPADKFAQNPCTNSLRRMIVDVQDLRLMFHSEDLPQTKPTKIDTLVEQEEHGFGSHYVVKKTNP